MKRVSVKRKWQCWEAVGFPKKHSWHKSKGTIYTHFESTVETGNSDYSPDYCPVATYLFNLIDRLVMQHTEIPFSGSQVTTLPPFKIFEMLFVLFSLPSYHAARTPEEKKNSLKGFQKLITTIGWWEYFCRRKQSTKLCQETSEVTCAFSRNSHKAKRLKVLLMTAESPILGDSHQSSEGKRLLTSDVRLGFTKVWGKGHTENLKKLTVILISLCKLMDQGGT